MPSLRAFRGLGSMLLSVAGLGVCFGHSSLSDAYSDPYYYDTADIVAEGGSGRRWFTGSPHDRYTCVVCHTPTLRPWVEAGGTGEEAYGAGEGAFESPRPMTLSLEGIDANGNFEPGQTYLFELTVDAESETTAFVLEVTDGTGQAFGELSLADLAQMAVRNDDVYEPVLAEDEMQQRIIYVLGAPNAGVVQVQWRAPDAAAVGGAWLFAQAVHSDGSEDPSGDRTASLYLPLKAGKAKAVPRPGSGLGSGPSRAWLQNASTLGQLWLAPWASLLWHVAAHPGEREP